jgi:hypothetical protein
MRKFDDINVDAFYLTRLNLKVLLSKKIGGTHVPIYPISLIVHMIITDFSVYLLDSTAPFLRAFQHMPKNRFLGRERQKKQLMQMLHMRFVP